MASDNCVLRAHSPPNAAVAQILQPAMPVVQLETVLAATMRKQTLPNITNMQSHPHQ